MDRKPVHLFSIAVRDMRDGNFSTITWTDRSRPEPIKHVRQYARLENKIIRLHRETDDNGQEHLTITELNRSGIKQGLKISRFITPDPHKTTRTHVVRLYENDKLLNENVPFDAVFLQNTIALMTDIAVRTNKPAIELPDGKYTSTLYAFEGIARPKKYAISKYLLARLQDEDFLDLYSVKENSHYNQTILPLNADKVLHIQRVYTSENDKMVLQNVRLSEHNHITGMRDGLECSYKSPSYTKNTINFSQDLLAEDSALDNALLPDKPYGQRKIFKKGLQILVEDGVDQTFAKHFFAVEQQVRGGLHVQQNVKNETIFKQFQESSPPPKDLPRPPVNKGIAALLQKKKFPQKKL